MKIWEKIILGFLSVVLIMLSVGFITLFNNIRLVDQFKDLEFTKRAELTQSNRLSYTILKVRSDLTEQFLEIKDKEGALEPSNNNRLIESNLRILSESLKSLQKATLRNYILSEEIEKEGEIEEINHIDSLEILISNFTLTINKIFTLQNERKYTEAKSLLDNTVVPISEKIQSIINSLGKDAENEVDWSLMQMNSDLNQLIQVSIYITLICCVLAISIGLFISKSITRVLDKLTNCAKEIGRGNLHVRVEINSKDELKILANSFNGMAQELQTKITSIDNLNKELLASNGTKDTLFSIIAHDLKNPFNSIIGFSHLLHSNYYAFDDEKRRMYIGEIEKSSLSTYELLENLLTWARSQSGKIQIKKENINLLGIVEDSVTSYISNAAHKKIDIITNISSSITVFADKFTLSIVINNILSNAIKFTMEGGEIIISAKSFASHIELSIKDTGIGMSQKTINNLLATRNHSSSMGTNREKGTGFGLILIKDFIKENDGQLWIESEIGAGSEFRFSLPNGSF